MFDISCLNPNKNVTSKEALLQENMLLKRQLHELLMLGETGFFIELGSLLKVILKKTLALSKAKSSFFSVTSKDPSELDIRLSNFILKEEMDQIHQSFKAGYQQWQESEVTMMTMEDFTILPLVRRHKILGVIGIKLTSDAPDNIYEILPVIANQAASSLESAILYERMLKRLLVLSNVFILGKEIISNVDITHLIKKFLSIACNSTDSEIACLYLFRDNENTPYDSIIHGINGTLSFISESNGYSKLIQTVHTDEQPIVIDNLDSHEIFNSELNKIEGKSLSNTLVLPLKPCDRLIGVIQMANKAGNISYSPEDLDILKILGSQVAFVIQNFELFQDLRKTYTDTLSALTSAIDAKDSYTRGHSERVTDISLKLATAMGIAPSEIEKIKLGGLLHDIGKIGIHEGVLNKPGRLSDEEFEIIKSHPELGVMILEKVKFLEMIVPIIRYHHERFDGKGYPEGLEGQNIPILARIVSVADTYDAMTTSRPYREAMTAEQALAEIERCSGTQFDPEVATHLIRLINKESDRK